MSSRGATPSAPNLSPRDEQPRERLGRTHVVERGDDDSGGGGKLPAGDEDERGVSWGGAPGWIQ